MVRLQGVASLKINLKNLSEPVTKLINAVSKAIGTVYEPTRIVREAKATAEASLILAQGEIEKQELLLRAAHRLAFVETRRQQIIEAITNQAVAALPNAVSKDPVSEDWMVQFFDNCKDVGETELQALWARILAGEVTQPHSFSRRTLGTLKLMHRDEAVWFTDLCCLGFKGVDAGSSFCFEQSAGKALYAKYGPLAIMSHLVTIGLLAPEWHTFRVSQFNGLVLDYLGQPVTFRAPRPPPNNLLEYFVQIRPFSGVGLELAKIVSAHQAPGFLEQLAADLAQFKIQIVPASKESGPPLSPNGPPAPSQSV